MSSPKPLRIGEVITDTEAHTMVYGVTCIVCGEASCASNPITAWGRKDGLEGHMCRDCAFHNDESVICAHLWYAGLMAPYSEDIHEIARRRGMRGESVECAYCERTYPV